VGRGGADAWVRHRRTWRLTLSGTPGRCGCAPNCFRPPRPSPVPADVPLWAVRRGRPR
jgi:hypothetical protein